MKNPYQINRREVLGIAAGGSAYLMTSLSPSIIKAGETAASKFDYDAVIVGGGPSGLSAALVLGRSCRKVLVCDEGNHRNRTSVAVHSYFSRDGINPSRLLEIGRDQLRPYDVDFEDVGVVDAANLDNGFLIQLRNGNAHTTRKLIFATGLKDELPDIEGINAQWGTGVLHCPYCHGWEVRDKPWAYITDSEQAIEWGTELLEWASTLTFCSNGPSGLTDAERSILESRGVTLREERIKRLDEVDGDLKSILFENGNEVKIEALFVRTSLSQRSSLPEKLGCVMSSDNEGFVDTDCFGATSVSGLFIVGDASMGAPQVATAVADGALTAIMVNKAIIKEDNSGGEEREANQ